MMTNLVMHIDVSHLIIFTPFQ